MHAYTHPAFTSSNAYKKCRMYLLYLVPILRQGSDRRNALYESEICFNLSIAWMRYLFYKPIIQ